MSGTVLTAEQREWVRQRLLQGPLPGVNFSDAYAQIAQWLDGVPGAESVRSWFRGATQANRGEGPYSEIIRNYTLRQAQLRGITVDPAQMQAASNNVALRVLEDIANGVPLTLEVIANRDATAVGQTVFSGLAGDTALTQNAGWAGAVLFLPMGSDQSYRMVSAGQAGVPDTLDDWKNLLLSYDAFVYAIKSVSANPFDWNVWDAASIFNGLPNASWSDLVSDIVSNLVSTTDYEFGPKLSTMFQGTALAAPFASIGKYGVPATLDMLMSAYQGRPINTTSEGNYASVIGSFFGQISPADTQSRSVRFIGDETLDQYRAGAMVDVRYRNALQSLSAFLMDPPAGSAGSLQLYDRNTGEGEITEEWIRARSSFLVFMNLYRGQRDNDGVLDAAGLPVPIPGDIDLKDFSSAQNPISLKVDGVDLGILDERRFYFGGQGSDSLAGGEGDDRLFGGAGNDVIQGGEGDDYLEGGTGNDRIDGGDDADIIEAGAGDDILRGGDGADQLKGGIGFDTYRVGNGDIVKDLKGRGLVYWENTLLVGGSRKEDDPPNTYYSEDGEYTYVLAGDNLTVSNSSGESFLIEDFVNHDLGIDLDDEEDDDDDDDEERPDVDDAENRTSPIIIDLDGDGVETRAYSRDRYFDHDANGMRESTAWAGADDGFLVRDLNQDGAITSGREMFGNNTLLSDGTRAEHGFDALRALDDNQDGLINAQDAAFAELRIWRDVNGNGRTDAGELLTLQETGIAALRTQWTASTLVDANGQKHAQTGSAVRENGTSAAVSDVWFTVDNGYRLNTSDIEIPDELLGLPNAKAFGNLKDLRQAMASDPVLKALVEAFIATEDPVARDAQLEGLIFQWTGVAHVDPNSRDPSKVYGHVMDARQLIVLETLIGRGYEGTWCWGEKDPNPHGNAAPLLIAEFKEFSRFVRAQLIAQIDADDYSFIKGGFASGYSSVLVDWSAFVQKAGEIRAAGELGKLSGMISVLNDLGTYSPDFRRERDQAFAHLQGAYPDLAPLFNTPSVIGTLGSDTLFGSSRDEVIVGQQGNDSLYGGFGNDNYFYRAGDGNDRIYDRNGVEQLIFLEGIAASDVVLSRDLTSIFARITLNGVESQIRIDNFFDENGFLHEGVIESIKFNDGTHWDLNTILSRIVLPITEGADTVYGSIQGDTIAALGGDDNIHGLEGDDQLQGGGGNDVLVGGNGNDVLAGDAGTDLLNGGAGSDVYRFGAGGGRDTIESFDDAAGRIDRIVFDAGIAPENVQVRRQGDDLLLVLSATDSILVRRHFSSDGVGSYSINQVDFANGVSWNAAALNSLALGGTAGADTLTAFASDDLAHGLEGDDTIRGGGGNDTLHGDEGNDNLQGETGDDALLGGAGTDRLDGGEGQDNLQGGSGNDIALGGFGDDQLRGDDGNDHLIGEAGHDQLRGGLGNDRLEGGFGDDNYFFARGDGKDTILDVQGQSTIYISSLTVEEAWFRRDGTQLVIRFLSSADDEIRLENFFDGASGLAQRGLRIDPGNGLIWDITPQGMDAEVLKPTAGDDLILGNSLDNTVFGLAGNDTIRGEGGSDKVDGGDGNDSLFGNAGDDILIGGAGADRLEGGDGVDELSGDAGDDTLRAGTENDHLAGGAGKDQLHGEAGDDVLLGGEDDDLLDGGAGVDQLTGGAGSDTYIVDDVADSVAESANEGADTIQSSVTYTIANNVEALVLTGSANIDATGNSADNELTGNSGDNRIEGLAGHDVLSGGDGSDTLIAGTGDDVLDGGSGTDHLSGGMGDDAYTVDSESDVVVELGGEGNDTVYAHSDYALSENVETLVLVEGSGASIGVGHVGSQTLIGNSLSNRLDGGAGADTLRGGEGNDTYVVDHVGDLVVELADEGSDTVESSISYVLGSPLENLVLVGSADLHGTGNAADNVLVGNDGQNRLEGGLGADDLYGGLGNDYFITESIGDWVFEQDDEGLDTLERRFETNLILFNHVEDLILASGVTTGNGNNLDNLITGNAGDNRLAGLAGDDELLGLDGNDSMWGGVGADTLIGSVGDDYLDGEQDIDHLEGGAGNDVYIVDHADDVVIEAANEGTDQVQSTSSYVLSANIEHLFLTGTGAINGTGNALDNFIAGNDAANVIHGEGGSDTIVAGGGNDTLTGGAGDDKYVFDATSGSDGVNNAGGGNDGIFFINGVTRERLSFTREGNDLLIWVDQAATPAVRVTNHFLGGDAAIDYVQPDGGFLLTTAEINQIVAGGSTGGQYDRVIEGTAAAEQLVGSSGKDLIKGLGGDDQLFGMNGDDTLQGGDGADYLAGGNGSGSGSGADRLEGGAGNDTLTGEDGANTLIGGSGDDSYIYQGGQDTIDNTGGGFDGLFFNDGLTVNDLAFAREGDDLLITVGGVATRTVRVTNHFLGGDFALDFLQPASGAMLNTAAINARVGGGSSTPPGGGNEGNDADYPNVVTGTAAGEQLLGTSGRDLIRGLGGNDTLFGFGGDDKFQGGDGDDYLSGGNGSFSGSGNDILIGNAGSDTLVGEDGNDMLIGGEGDDDYLYAAGSGSDTIDNTGGGADWVFFNGIARNRLSFHRDADDLIIRVDANANQQVRVLGHFLGGQNAISFVQPGSGFAIAASQIPGLLTPLPAGLSEPLAESSLVAESATTDVHAPLGYRNEVESLIAAMASFSPESAASVTLTAPSVSHHQWLAASPV